MQCTCPGHHEELRFITNFKSLTHQCLSYAHVGCSALSSCRQNHELFLIYKTILGLLPSYLSMGTITVFDPRIYSLCLLQRPVLNWKKRLLNTMLKYDAQNYGKCKTKDHKFLLASSGQHYENFLGVPLLSSSLAKPFVSYILYLYFLQSQSCFAGSHKRALCSLDTVPYPLLSLDKMKVETDKHMESH